MTNAKKRTNKINSFSPVYIVGFLCTKQGTNYGPKHDHDHDRAHTGGSG